MKYIIALFAMCLWLPKIANAQTLAEYDSLAAANNPGLKAKYIAFEAALKRTPQVSALPDPTFSFGYFISPVETRVGPQRAKLSISQMFPWFGTLKAQEDATAALAQSKFLEFLDARNKLYQQVASVYFPLTEINSLIEIEKENIQILTTYKNIAQSKFENGESPMVDVLRADITLQDAQTNLDVLLNRESSLRAWFNSILNRDYTAEVNLPPQQKITESDLVVLRDSVANNPLLTRLDAMQQSSVASQKAAARAGLPKIGVGLDYVITGKRTDMSVPNNGQDAFMPMVSVSVPIFRGKYKAAVSEAKLMEEAYSLQKEELTNNLNGLFYRYNFELQQQFDLLQLYQKQLVTAHQSLKLLYTTYSNSGKDFEEVLRMQQQLLTYKKLSVQAHTAFKIAQAELDYITAKKHL